jgi:hypothetical protein
MVIGTAVELLLVLAVLIVTLMYLPAAVFKFILDALLVVWAAEVAVLVPVCARVLLKNRGRYNLSNLAP